MDSSTRNHLHSLEIQPSRDWSWRFWPLLPLYPYSQRRTLRREVVPDTIWAFDQTQGIFYVVVPIRMTVVKLAKGGLLVYAPVAPTPECIRLMRELETNHGAVKYIILPTVSGLEHKVYVGPFARQFPQAQVYVAPHQWSFPVNLPLSWLGLPAKRTQILPADACETPFGDEFDYAILGPIQLGLGPFEEVAFFHRRSRSLLVTDSVISIPQEPPEIVLQDPYPLLFHARDLASDRPANTPENRRKGWHRIALFACFFRPSALDVVDLVSAIRNALSAPERSRRAYFGVYPFRWKAGWERSFASLQGEGRLLVAPILQTLILNRAPQETYTWVKRVASWDFWRIIPCHFDCPIPATPQQFQQAFAFLSPQLEIPLEGDRYPLPPEDFELLRELEQGLSKTGIVPPLTNQS